MKNKFIKGAVILSLSNIIIKVLGVFYRIPLSRILTTVGIGYATIANDIYNLFIGLSTSGINIAIAKLVSERLAKNDYYGAKRVFEIALLIGTIVGLILSILLFISGDLLTKFLKNDNVYYSIIALAPGLLFVPIMSSFRGYFQGHNNMIHTAVSQIIEQVFRIFSGLLLGWIFITKGIDIASGGVSLGVSIAAFSALLYMAIVYVFHRKKRDHRYIRSEKDESETNKAIIMEILKISVPLSLGAIAMPLISFIEKAMITRRLLTLGFLKEDAADLIGQIALGRIVLNFPLIFSISLSTSLLPVISEYMTNKNKEDLNKTIKSSLFIIILIGLPSSLGIWVLSKPIIQLLFSTSTNDIELTSKLLSISSISVIFIMVTQCMNVYLNGLGKVHIPIRNIMISGVFKLILTYILLSYRMIAMYGSVISTIIFYIIIVILDFIAIKQYTNIEIDIQKLILKPLISSIIMGYIVFITKYIILQDVKNILSIAISVVIGVLVYSILIFKFIGIEERYLSFLPYHEQIIPILKRIHLLD
ncbi:polysaccharide biosynthesis protein [Clostridium sp. D2Q-11]|uniref:Polysaccharide biosynthesis protein n=1 Tax=Anaeromonas frigoriresistens TaxID=2683708 RepID=A0A942UVI8_9FIRM|nr:polysaccharide biosynthesis protein [Anaeromonas frigoriresistens]MBS4537589.1 polysaccharide biosynthesis protein [Anaeromonas frigoriresistens]